MAILRVLIKGVLFLVGLLFLGSGLFCGLIGSPSALLSSVIGVALAVLVFFLISLMFSKDDKNNEADPLPPDPPSQGDT